VKITFDPTKEKISSSLEVYGPYVLASLAGLSEKIGLPYPRVGHLVEIDRQTGAIAHVFNSECSNRTTILVASTCPESEGGIWGRIPATVDPSGNLLVATADGAWNGHTDWGDSVLELSPTLKLLQSYTPADQEQLAVDDLDLGSTAPVVLTPKIVLQAGKDGIIRLLDLDRLNGRTHAAAPLLGGDISTVKAPGGGPVRPQPAVWRRPGHAPWVFVANDFGIEGFELALEPKPHLVLMWTDGRAGSSPVIAGGLLYIYNVDGGGLSVYNPDPSTGTEAPNEPLLTLSIPPGHWNSPVVADGQIALGDGDANDHATTGDLYIWRLPPASTSSSG
jgi:outer membrane protein assembly factor BamB